jgi:hypothetical protein
LFRRLTNRFRRRTGDARPVVAGPCRSVDLLEPRLAPATTQFAVIGDYGSAGTPEADVAALVRGWNPDLIITLGDNNYETGSAATIDANVGQYYHDFIGNYVGGYGAGSAVNRFFPTLGNHDWITRSGTPALPTPYLDYFTLPGNERYYTFTSGPVQFFALDSGDGTGTITDGFEPDGYTSTSVQAQWLQAGLAASTAPWKIVYFHHAPYSSGPAGSIPVMQWPFRAWGASAVLAGHDHTYERLTVGGLPYFVNGVGGDDLVAFTGTPIAGSQVRFDDDFGAMRVEATDTSIRFQFITRSGAVIDTHTIQAVPLPTVTVAATDATAAEPGTNTGTFTVTRTGSTAASLAVNLTVGGTAVHGADYAAIGGTVTIPAGSATATIRVTPVDDGVTEGSETAIVSIAPNSAYAVGTANTATVTVLDDDVSVAAGPVYAVAAGPGAGSPQVIVYNANGSVRFRLVAFPGFVGGVRVATGDVTGDGTADVVAAAGPGGGPHVRVFDGRTGGLVREFFAFSPGFAGGVFVAAADLTGDGRAEVVVGAGAGGGPHVRVFSVATGAEVFGFFAFDVGFTGGVSVAAGDVTGDSRADVIVGAGPGGGPHVKAFDGRKSGG